MPIATFTHKGFTPDQLREAFDLIHDPDDWRAPIAVTVPGELVTLTVAAIEFFTATDPKVSMIPIRDGDLMIRFLVESEGYRLGPAGDH